MVIRLLRRSLPLLVGLAAVPAGAAERYVSLAGFDRVRVQGPFEVTVAASRLPGATLTGDRDAIDAVVVQVEGTTLTVRGRLARVGPAGRAAAARPVAVSVGSDVLVGASVVDGGRVRAARLARDRADVAVTGAGAVEVAAVDTPTLNATVIGTGSITLAGRAGAARLMTNGPGTIDAEGLEANALFVRLDGPGATRARARYTARVIDTGAGQVTVAGRPKCTIAAPAGAPVNCGSVPIPASEQR